MPLVLVGIVASLVAADYWSSVPLTVKKTYVGRQTCIECHAQQYDQWKGSDHDLAMREATDDTVLGDFNDQRLEHFGIESRMFRDGERFLVTTEGPDGELATYEVKYAFGYDPLQQYLVEFPGGRLQALPIAWDTERREWFFLMPPGETERIPPDDVLHWTGPSMNWNHMCADCHSTDLRKNYDLDSDTFHTSFHEVNVSCEACHGPGSLHVDLAQARSLFWDRNHGFGLPKLKGKENAQTQIETCAKCHSRRHTIAEGSVAGSPFMDHYVPQLLGSRVHHVDGQLRPEEEGYVYNSFLQSKMHRMGVRCTDCHDPHTTKLIHEGNQLCGQCHQPAQYDTPLHHHHPVDSKGASCVECHMPHTTYMMVDPRRDHSIRVPRPDLSVKLGTPNACNNCHDAAKGEDAAWAAEAVEKWYGPKRRLPHYGEAIFAALEGEPDAEAKLIAIFRRDSGDNDVGTFVRASAVHMLGERFLTRRTDAVLQDALKDDDPMIRHAAVEAFLHPQRSSDDKLRVAPLLNDPIRAVRIAAANVLSDVHKRLPSRFRDAYERALQEFRTSLEEHQDQPGAHTGLGLMAARQGARSEAIGHYATALEIDPRFYQARLQKAILQEEAGDVSAAERLLREGTAVLPDHPDTFFSLGLLLAQLPDRQDDAIEALGQAVELAPDRARYRYNYGLILEHAGQPEAAREQLQQAVILEPRDPETRFALLLTARTLGDWATMRAQARWLVDFAPDNPEFRHHWAVAALQGGQLDEAWDQIERAVRMNPQSQQYRLTQEMIRRARDGE